jgi:hypothetical protein
MSVFVFEEFQLFNDAPLVVEFDEKRFSYGSRSDWMNALSHANKKKFLPSYVLYSYNDQERKASYDRDGIDCCIFLHGMYHAAYVKIKWEAFFSMSKSNRMKLENYDALKDALMSRNRIDIDRLDCEHYQIESLYKLITNQKGLH